MGKSNIISFEVELPIYDASQESNLVKRVLRKWGVLGTHIGQFKFAVKKKLSAFDEIKRLNVARQITQQQIGDADYYDTIRAQTSDIEQQLGINAIEQEYYDELADRLKEIPLGDFDDDEKRKVVEEKREQVIIEEGKKREEKYVELFNEGKDKIEITIALQKLTAYRNALRLIDMTSELLVALVDIPEELQPLEEQETVIVTAIWNRYQEVVSPFRCSWIVARDR